jgi:hypothetical protein
VPVASGAWSRRPTDGSEYVRMRADIHDLRGSARSANPVRDHEIGGDGPRPLSEPHIDPQSRECYFRASSAGLLADLQALANLFRRLLAYTDNNLRGCDVDALKVEHCTERVPLGTGLLAVQRARL